MRELLLRHPLFSALTDAQRAWLVSRCVELRVPEGEPVFAQGDLDADVYVVVEGAVDIVLRRDDTPMTLSRMERGDYFGEMALLREAPRSATALAVAPTRLARIPRDALLHAPGGSLVPRLLANHVDELNERLLRANEQSVAALRRALEKALDHKRLALVLTVLISLFSVYSYVVGALRATSGVGLLFASLAVAGCASAGALVFMRMSHRPMADFGFTVAGLGPALVEALAWAVGLSAVATLLKALAIAFLPGWAGLPLVMNPMAGSSAPMFAGLLLVYGLSSLVQELAARSFLQTSFALLLPGPLAGFRSIALSNLIFSVFHLHYNANFALLTFVSGLVFGAFWVRRPNLPAAALFHTLAGFWAMDVLDLFHLPGFAL